MNGQFGRLGHIALGPCENGSPYRPDEISAITEIAELAGRTVEMGAAGASRGPGGIARRGPAMERLLLAEATRTGARAHRRSGHRSDRFAGWSRPSTGLRGGAD